MAKQTTHVKFPVRFMAGLLAMILLLGLLPLSAGAIDYICGKEEHTHTEICYEDRESVVYTCDPGACIHHHDDFCYDSTGALVCKLEEAAEHTHTESCYTQEDTQSAYLWEGGSSGTSAFG